MIKINETVLSSGSTIVAKREGCFGAIEHSASGARTSINLYVFLGLKAHILEIHETDDEKIEMIFYYEDIYRYDDYDHCEQQQGNIYSVAMPRKQLMTYFNINRIPDLDELNLSNTEKWLSNYFKVNKNIFFMRKKTTVYPGEYKPNLTLNANHSGMISYNKCIIGRAVRIPRSLKHVKKRRLVFEFVHDNKIYYILFANSSLVKDEKHIFNSCFSTKKMYEINF